MKRKLILAGAGLLALAALTGCGGGNQESGKLVIEFWHTFGDAVGNGVDEAARKFEKLVKDNEGVDLEIDAINNFTYQTAQSYLTPTLTAGSNCVMAVSYADTVAELMALESYDGQFVVNMEDYLTNSEYGLGKFLIPTIFPFPNILYSFSYSFQNLFFHYSLFFYFQNNGDLEY